MTICSETVPQIIFGARFGRTMPDPAGEPWEFLEAHGLEPGGQAPEKHDRGGDFGAKISGESHAPIQAIYFP